MSEDIEIPTLYAGGEHMELPKITIAINGQESLPEGPALLAASSIIEIDAGTLGHTPDGRGRRTGPNDRYWRDYCTTTAGKICYGPYHDLEPGVYEYYYDLSVSIPACGNADDTIVFEMDSTQDIGHTIPGSKRFVFRWKFMCEHADQNNVFSGAWGGKFAIAEKATKVEMRLGNVVTKVAGLPVEILVRQLRYWKSS